MREFKGKRYWLVGASEGLGRALAHELSAAGAELILSARGADRLHSLAAELPGASQVVPVDLSDRDSVRAAADQAGRIDGMVYLAGVYWPMEAPGWDTDQAETMIDINLQGAIRVIGACLPDMLARGAGHIVLTGSLSGLRGLPGAVGYSTSKAGMVSLAETMALDLRGSGVAVQLVNPGFIRTRLTDKNDFKMPQIMEPEKAAKIMMGHLRSQHFAKSFPRPFSWVFRVANIVPDWLFFRMF